MPCSASGRALKVEHDMSPYEQLAARLIGTPLQRPAEWLREIKRRWQLREHPELAEIFMEGGRADAYVRRVVTAQTNCIDVGCHIGSFLHKFVTLAPNGHHLAFEPVTTKAQWLQRRFPTVEVHAVALSDHEATADFYVNTRQTAFSGLVARRVSGVPGSVQVPCRTLDEVMQGHTRTGFVKIDVNGAESMVLRGAIEFLRRERPFLLVECTREGLADYGVDSDQVFTLLTKRAGYRIHLLKEWLVGGPALDAGAFRQSMEYPFQAFNFAVVPDGAQGGAASPG